MKKNWTSPSIEALDLSATAYSTKIGNNADGWYLSNNPGGSTSWIPDPNPLLPPGHLGVGAGDYGEAS